MYTTSLGRIICVSSCLALACCASAPTTPGMDRVTFESSQAEIGPVETESGELVPGTELDADLEIATTSPVTQAPETSMAESADQAQNVEKKILAPASAANESTLAKLPAPAEAAKPIKPQIDSPTKVEAPAVAVPEIKAVPVIQRQAVVEAYELSGEVSLLTKKGKVSPKGVIVRLKRTDGQSIQTAPTIKVQSHDVDMVNKTYQPGNLVVRKGDILNFVNKDSIQHNVFSSTGTNAFDLGTFGGGLQRKVRLNDDGIAKVYCNIHPKMATFVAVDDLGQSQVIDSEQGDFKFDALPGGEYELTLWSIRGEHKQTLVIDDSLAQPLKLTLNVNEQSTDQHLNKFGQTYKKKNIIGEFY